MATGMKVSLGPGDFVLDGDLAHPERGTATPHLFGPCLLRPNGRPSQLLLTTCYRQHCAQRKAPVFKLLRGRFWGFTYGHCLWHNYCVTKTAVVTTAKTQKAKRKLMVTSKDFSFVSAYHRIRCTL